MIKCISNSHKKVLISAKLYTCKQDSSLSVKCLFSYWLHYYFCVLPTSREHCKTKVSSRFSSCLI